MSVRWRRWTDRMKHSPMVLRLADYLGRGRGRWRFLDQLAKAPAARRPNLSRWHKSELAAIWIGHATVLLRIGGKTILTDPVLANRIGVGLGVMTGGPMRFVAPALSLAQLPPLDLILVSHAHYDHLDCPTLARLPKNVPVITSHCVGDIIRDLGFRRVTEMRWGEEVSLSTLKIRCHPAQHWGARTFIDQQRGFGAFLIESRTGNARRILFGGDTAYCDHFRDVGKVDLAIFGIGAYDPYIQAHATPEQAWDMANQMRADHVLPMHHSTFRLSHEPMDEPIERMLLAAGAERARIIATVVGEQWAV